MKAAREVFACDFFVTVTDRFAGCKLHRIRRRNAPTVCTGTCKKHPIAAGVRRFRTACRRERIASLCTIPIATASSVPSGSRSVIPCGSPCRVRLAVYPVALQAR